MKKYSLDGLTGEELESAKNFNAMIDKIESIEKQGVDVSELKTQLESVKTNADKVIALEATVKDISRELAEKKTEGDGKKKEIFTDEIISNIEKAISEGRSQNIAIKSAAAMTTANITSGTHLTSYEVVPGIQSAPREENAILPALLKGRTNGKTIYWANRINEDGGSAFIGEGVLKPLKDFDLAEESSVAKKVAVRGNYSRELVNDVAGFRDEMATLLRVDLLEKIESELLESNASSTTLTGILTVAPGYTTTTLDDLVEKPNKADALRAAALQMRLLNYKPNVAFLNPADAALMDLTKDSNGNYIRFQLDGVIRQLRLIETTAIDAGNFLVMDTRKWFVKMYEDIMIEYGLNADDFSKNMMSVIVEARLHSYYNSIDLGAFMYESFDTVISAIEKPNGI